MRKFFLILNLSSSGFDINLSATQIEDPGDMTRATPSPPLIQGCGYTGESKRLTNGRRQLESGFLVKAHYKVNKRKKQLIEEKNS